MSNSDRGIIKENESRAIESDDARGAARRGTDERRDTVNPVDNPAPRSPEPDREAVEKGEATLERVKPY